MNNTIGVVVNCDTRPGYLDNETYCGKIGGMSANGARSSDFIVSNVLNKRRFFRGYDIELTLYIDLHTAITPDVWGSLQTMVGNGAIDNLVIAKHSDIYKGRKIRQWQDINYLNALTMSKSKYIAHFDADTSAYRRDDCNIINRFKKIIDSGEYKYISYPSFHSPNEGDVPGENAYPTEGQSDKPDYLWASTRFFFCNSESIKYDEFIKLLDDKYWIAQHNGKPHRYPNVTEQILGFTAGANKVMFAPKELEEYMIFCWHTYHKGTIERLRHLNYEEVYKYVMETCGGIGGACDVNEDRL